MEILTPEEFMEKIEASASDAIFDRWQEYYAAIILAVPGANPDFSGMKVFMSLALTFAMKAKNPECDLDEFIAELCKTVTLTLTEHYQSEQPDTHPQPTHAGPSRSQ